MPILEHQDEPLLEDIRPEVSKRNDGEFEDLELGGNPAFLIDTSSSFNRQSIRTERGRSDLMPSNIFDDL